MNKINSLAVMLVISSLAFGQKDQIDSSKYPALTTFTAQQDQAQMMQQLGIKKLRPGPSSNQKDLHHANEDETIADPCPELPDALTTKAGKKVATAEQWRTQRRNE